MNRRVHDDWRGCDHGQKLGRVPDAGPSEATQRYDSAKQVRR
jgi:hypothetical protein